MTIQDSKEVHRFLKTVGHIDSHMSETEQIHYFGLCKPDHSDCSYPLCMYQNMRRRGEFKELEEILKQKGRR